MTAYLLDTDSIIDYLKGFDPTIELIQNRYTQGDDLCITSVVLAEVYSGLHPQEIERAEELLTTLHNLPLTPDAGRQAGRWRYQFARQGRQLSTADCLNAAAAYEYNAQIITGNISHYPMQEIAIFPLPRQM